MTERTVHRFRYPVLYGMCLVLVGLPIGMELRLRLAVRTNRTRVRLLLAAAALSVVMSVPLFWVAIDWGRWIAIHAVCLLLLLLHAFGEEGAEGVKLRALLPRGRSLAGAAVLAAYAGLWTLPFYGGYPARLGYVGLARYLLNHGGVTKSARPVGVLPGQG